MLAGVSRLRRSAVRLRLQDPERAVGVTFLDGFSSAFLAGLLFPPVSIVVIVMFTSSGRTDLGDYVAALLAGPLLGGSAGLGLWRAAVAGRIAGPAGRLLRTLGVAAGLVLGQLASALTARCLLSAENGNQPRLPGY